MRKLLLDMDECGAGMVWPSPERPWKPASQAVWAEILALCGEHEVRIHPLSNRPPGQMPLVTAILGGGANWAISESGGSAYIPALNTLVVNPLYSDFTRHTRPEIVRRLVQRFSPSPDGPYVLELGDKQVQTCIFPRADLPASTPGVLDQPELETQVRALLADIPGLEVRIAGGIDVFPCALSKRQAVEWIPDLHARFQADDPLDWSECLYVDDANSALDAMRLLRDLGGCPATVANGGRAVRQFCREDGFASDEPFERGVLEVLRAWLSATG